SRPFGCAEDADERHHDERKTDNPAIDAAVGAKPPADAAIGIGRPFRRDEGSLPGDSALANDGRADGAKGAHQVRAYAGSDARSEDQDGGVRGSQGGPSTEALTRWTECAGRSHTESIGLLLAQAGRGKLPAR